VAQTADQVVGLVEGILDDGMQMHPDYSRRAGRFFTVRDGRACKRTYRAIARLAKRPASHW
jgi:hypothetical protein